MARARNIKPGFFVNEELVELPFEYRLLYIGLWTLADREGRLEDRPTKIRMAIFPADDVDCVKGISALERVGFLVRYVVDDRALIDIPAFKTHQTPHHKEVASTLPPRVQPSCMPTGTRGQKVMHESEGKGEPGAEGVVQEGQTVLIADTGYRIPESLQPPRPKKPPNLDLPEWLEASLWQRWDDFRRRKGGKAWTDDAKALSLRTLDKLRAEGHPPQTVIEQSIERGYTGLFAPKTDDKSMGGHSEWWRTKEGIEAMGRELRMQARGTEDHWSFAERMRQHLRATHAA